MAEDDQDRANEAAAEREAEINSEMERVGQDPDQVKEGSDSLGTQSAPSGTTRDDEVADESAGSEESAAERDEQETDPEERSGETS